jgi:chromosome segregation ATPase
MLFDPIRAYHFTQQSSGGNIDVLFKEYQDSQNKLQYKKQKLANLETTLVEKNSSIKNKQELVDKLAAEIAKLEKGVVESKLIYDTAVDAHKLQLQQKAGQINALEADQVHKEALIEKIEKELEVKTKDLEELKSEKTTEATLLQQKAKLYADIKNSTVELAKLAGEKAELQKSLDAEKAAHQVAVDGFQKLEKTLKEEIDAKTKIIKEKEASIHETIAGMSKKANEEAAKLLEEIGVLKVDLNLAQEDLEKALKENSDSAEKQQKTVETLTAQIKSQENELLQAKKDLGAYEVHDQEQYEQVEKIKMEVESLKLQLAEAVKAKGNLSGNAKALAEKEAQLKTLQETNEALKASKELKAKELKELETAQQEASKAKYAEIQTLSSEIEQLKANLKEAKKQFSEVELEKQELTNDKKELILQIEENKKSIDASAKSLQSLEEKNKLLEKSQKQLAKEIEELKTKDAQSSAKLAQLEEQKVALEKQQEKISEQKAALEGKVATLEKSNQTLSEKYSEVVISKEQLAQQLEDVKSSAKEAAKPAVEPTVKPKDTPKNDASFVAELKPVEEEIVNPVKEIEKEEPVKQLSEQSNPLLNGIEFDESRLNADSDLKATWNTHLASTIFNNHVKFMNAYGKVENWCKTDKVLVQDAKMEKLYKEVKASIDWLKQK